MSLKIGFAAEEEARLYLCKQGLTWVASNYRSRLGEIDLIMQDRDAIVFVEVRARASSAFGGALASVTPQKIKKLLKTASLYLLSHKLTNNRPVRFDVVSIDGRPPTISWIKNAFGTDF